jgi:hypothetical protein
MYGRQHHGESSRCPSGVISSRSIIGPLSDGLGARLAGFVIFLGTLFSPAVGTPVERFTSPTGTGSACTKAAPCANEMAIAASVAGDSITLLDGIYRGIPQMIAPGMVMPGRSGVKGKPITVRALNDGEVTIDGEFVRQPVHFAGNSWWVLEGFNAKNGATAGVIYLSRGSSNNILRRVVAWDAHIDRNNAVVLHQGGSSNNLFEDCAAFGTGRKVAGAGNGSIGNTYRRCWFRWEGSTWGSPIGVTMAYNSSDATFENVLVTWSGESMPESYTNVSPRIPMRDFAPYAPAGILSVDRIDRPPPKHANIKLRGSVVYTKATDRIPTRAIGGAPGRVFPRLVVFGASSVAIEHVVSVMDPSHPRFNELFGMSLTRKPQNCRVKAANCEDPVVDNTAVNITSIRGTAGDVFHPDWTVRNESVGSSLAVVQSPWTANAVGANVCFRWGTTTPLWPWPMNDRIKTATGAAGSYSGPCPSCIGGRSERVTTDVTADIETLLGTITSACRR